MYLKIPKLLTCPMDIKLPPHKMIFNLDSKSFILNNLNVQNAVFFRIIKILLLVQ